MDPGRQEKRREKRTESEPTASGVYALGLAGTRLILTPASARSASCHAPPSAAAPTFLLDVNPARIPSPRPTGALSMTGELVNGVRSVPFDSSPDDSPPRPPATVVASDDDDDDDLEDDDREALELSFC